MVEEWREIPGFSGWYRASSFGRLRSMVASVRGVPRYRKVPRILRPGMHRRHNGYLRVCLAGKNTQLVHRLILLTFVGPQPIGKEGSHIDGNKENNAIDNLVWATRAENHCHSRISLEEMTNAFATHVL